MTAPTILIETATGTRWRAAKTTGTGRPERQFWVSFESGERSQAQPGIVGFYAHSISVAQRMLNGATIA